MRDGVEDCPVEGCAVGAGLGAGEEIDWRAHDGSVPPEREASASDYAHNTTCNGHPRPRSPAQEEHRRALKKLCAEWVCCIRQRFQPPLSPPESKKGDSESHYRKSHERYAYATEPIPTVALRLQPLEDLIAHTSLLPQSA